MTSFLRRVLWPAIALLIAMTVITGAAYPALITAVAQVVFPHQANGSVIVANGQTVGSSLIGQCFDQDKYFWGRPSAAGATDGQSLWLRRERLGRLQSRTDEPGSPRSHQRAGRRLAVEIRHHADPGRPGNDIRIRLRS